MWTGCNVLDTFRKTLLIGSGETPTVVHEEANEWKVLDNLAIWSPIPITNILCAKAREFSLDKRVQII